MSETKDQSPSKLPSFDVTMALASLENSRITRTETKDTFTSVKFSYPQELLSVFRGLFGGGRSYRFMIHSSSPQAATVAGAVLGAYSWNPATTTFSEWSALSALFDEVRLISSHLVWTSMYNPAVTTNIVAQVTIAPDYVNDGVAPTGFTAVNRLAGSKEFSIAVNVNGGGSSTIKFSARTLNRLYASTATPSTSSPPAGCRGQWSWATTNAITNSQIYAQTAVRNIVSLRARA